MEENEDISVSSWIVNKIKKEISMGSFTVKMGPVNMNVSFKDIERLAKVVKSNFDKEKELKEKEALLKKEADRLEAEAIERAKKEEQEALASAKKTKVVAPSAKIVRAKDILDAEIEEEEFIDEVKESEEKKQAHASEGSDLSMEEDI